MLKKPLFTTALIASLLMPLASAQDSLSILVHEAPWTPAFETVVEAYEEQTGVQVNLNVTPYEGLLQKARNAATAPESEFDILEIDEVWTGQFYSGGLVNPLRDIDPDFTFDPEIIEYGAVSRWNPDTNAATEDGELYAVPLLGNIQLLFYRTDLLEEAGLSVPKTWDELQTVAEALNNPPNVYGFATRTSDRIDFDFQSVLRSYGGDIVSYNPDTQSWTVDIGSEASVTALEKWLELARAGSPPNYTNLGQAEMISLVQSGQLGMMINVAAAAEGLTDPDASVVVDNIAAAPVPGLTADEPVTTSGVLVFGVPVNLPDERKTAAAEFLEWLISQDTQMIFAQAGGIPVRTDVYDALSSDPEFWWAKAVSDSAPYIRGQLRIEPTSQIYEVLNRVLGEVLLDQRTPQEALEMAAEEITGIMEAGGFTVNN